MEIAFRVRNVEVPEKLRRVTLEKVTRLAGQCGIERVEVCFSEERNPRIAEREVCQITLFAQGRIVRAHAAATEVAVAVDRVVGKLEQQADRFRGRRLRGRRHPPECVRVISATGAGDGSVHFPTNWPTVRGDLAAADRFGDRVVDHVVDRIVRDAGEAADRGINDSRVEPMTPEEAALEMGEQGSEIYFFVNAETGRPAAVSQRNNGDIALFDFDAASAALRPT
jgi:ribosomal subunit interface protein